MSSLYIHLGGPSCNLHTTNLKFLLFTLWDFCGPISAKKNYEGCVVNKSHIGFPIHSIISVFQDQTTGKDDNLKARKVCYASLWRHRVESSSGVRTYRNRFRIQNSEENIAKSRQCLQTSESPQNGYSYSAKKFSRLSLPEKEKRWDWRQERIWQARSWSKLKSIRAWGVGRMSKLDVCQHQHQTGCRGGEKVSPD